MNKPHSLALLPSTCKSPIFYHLETGNDRSVTSVSIDVAADSNDGDGEESTGESDTDDGGSADDESDAHDAPEFEFDDDVPGFGIGAAIGALLVIALARARVR
ncbi:hypothetical protein [Natronosalvus amylolyticus]|uniref:hypothetical protein n=1 Tax=Natronosalvus amylolyticus TaxID=2961994 RepID=UPI0020C98436|nr:hypothetical protein [Natronosalvus amylolyticus]